MACLLTFDNMPGKFWQFTAALCVALLLCAPGVGATYFFCDGDNCNDAQIIARDKKGQPVFLDVFLASDLAENLRTKFRDELVKACEGLDVEQFYEDWKATVGELGAAAEQVTGSKPRWLVRPGLQRSYSEKVMQSRWGHNLQAALGRVRLLHRNRLAHLAALRFDAKIKLIEANATGNSALIQASYDKMAELDILSSQLETYLAEENGLYACFLAGRESNTVDDPLCDPDWSCTAAEHSQAVSAGPMSTWGCDDSSGCRAVLGHLGMRDVLWKAHRAAVQDDGRCQWAPQNGSCAAVKVYDPSQPPQSWCTAAVEANTCFLATRSMGCFCESFASLKTQCCETSAYDETDPFAALACGQSDCSSSAPVRCSDRTITTSSGAPAATEGPHDVSGASSDIPRATALLTSACALLLRASLQ